MAGMPGLPSHPRLGPLENVDARHNGPAKPDPSAGHDGACG